MVWRHRLWRHHLTFAVNFFVKNVGLLSSIYLPSLIMACQVYFKLYKNERSKGFISPVWLFNTCNLNWPSPIRMRLLIQMNLFWIQWSSENLSEERFWRARLRKLRISVDSKPTCNRRNKPVFSNFSCVVWTVPELLCRSNGKLS